MKLAFLIIISFLCSSFAMEPEEIHRTNNSLHEKKKSIEVLEQNIESAGINLEAKDLKTVKQLVTSFKNSNYKDFSKLLAGLVLEKYYQEEHQYTEKEKISLAQVFFGRTLNLSKENMKEIEKEERALHLIQVLFSTENTCPKTAKMLQEVCHKGDGVSNFKNKIATSILEKDGCISRFFSKFENAAKSGPGKFLLNTLMNCLIVGVGTNIN